MSQSRGPTVSSSLQSFFFLFLFFLPWNKDIRFSLFSSAILFKLLLTSLIREIERTNHSGNSPKTTTANNELIKFQVLKFAIKFTVSNSVFFRGCKNFKGPRFQLIICDFIYIFLVVVSQRLNRLL